MSINNYSVLKGIASAFALDDDENPHLNIRLEASGKSYRVAVNVRSKLSPHDLLYLKLDAFQNPLTETLQQLAPGLHPIKDGFSHLALDYVRGGFLERDQMMIAPYQLEGAHNDLRDYIEPIIKNNLGNEQVIFYAFGEPWVSQSGEDKFFHFSPQNGIHNIHMNQGSRGSFSKDNGVNQDGALLVHFLDQNRWVAFFLAFQSQSWKTDPQTGHPIDPGELPTGDNPARQINAGSMRILGALINPHNPEAGHESVTLINRSDGDIDLTGWQLADKENRTSPLSGMVRAGAVLQIQIGASQPIILSNRGGIIELRDKDQLVVDRVVYTKQDVRQEGWTTLF